MARPDQGAEFEFSARRILSNQADIGFDNRNFPLLHNQHRDKLDAHQERIQSVCAVQQRIVLQAYSSAVVQERLEVLIVVVEMVLVSQERLDDLTVFDAGLFHLLHVSETSQTIGNVPRLQRVPFKSSDDSNHVNQPWLRSPWLGRNPHQVQLLRFEPKGLRSQSVGCVHFSLQLG